MNETAKPQIRELKSDELPFLRDFLYEAVYRREDQPPYPRDIIDKPAIRVYIEGWGKPDDICLAAALADGGIAGAVWTRLLTGEAKGFGYVDDETPELAIALYKSHRGQGLGTALMSAMIDRLKKTGYSRVSLSVSKENPARRLYDRLGFVLTSEDEKDYVMVLELG